MRCVTLALGLSALVLCSGCDKDDEPGASAPSAGESPAPEAEAPGGARAPEAPSEQPSEPDEEEPAPQVLEEARVEALVERWARAQNEADFEAYKKTYADRLFGIKRVGPRTYSYDRKGWLEDRARMFKKDVAVTVEDLEIRAAPNSAVATFTQTWSSGSFKDVGSKQLVIIEQEGGELAIAREEMLHSEVSDIEAAADVLPTGYFGFVRDADGLGLVVDAATRDQLQGAPRTLSRGYSAMADVKESALDDPIKALKGQEVTFYGHDGERCRGTITDFIVFIEARPHFGELQEWNASEFSEATKPASDARVARELLELASIRGGPQSGLRLVARTDQKQEACARDALWGRLSQAPAPKLYTIEPAGEALSSKLNEAFSRLPASRQTQKEFTSNYDGTGDWWQADPNTTERLRIRGEGLELALQHTLAGEGCGDFYGDVWGLWEVAPGQKLSLVSDPKAPGVIDPIKAAADLDGDGRPELINDYQLLRPVDGTWRVRREARPPDFDCPC